MLIFVPEFDPNTIYWLKKELFRLKKTKIEDY